MDVAFKAARQYAPAGTKLFLNEYSTADAPRLACLVRVVREMRNRGVPIDGIGHEMHSAINYPSIDAVVNSIDTVAEHFPGIEQQITELDISVYNAGDNAANYGNNIPPSVLAEEGWLYKQYFEAFRRLKGKISAVTIWGFADDDTWLDSFPVNRTDYPLPFDMGLQAKPAYWGIVDPKELPGHGLKFSMTGKVGAKDKRVVTLTATNGDVGPAYTTQISSLTLHQIFGRHCSPVVTPPTTFPVVMGDIATNGTASASFSVDFSGCESSALFTLSAPWSSATYHTGTFVSGVEFWKDRWDDDNRHDGDKNHHDDDRR
jgi:endo-1,4-beta-xylanase